MAQAFLETNRFQILIAPEKTLQLYSEFGTEWNLQLL